MAKENSKAPAIPQPQPQQIPLAKKQDIPALVYEMSIQEARDYHHRVKNQPDMVIPGKPVPAPDKGQTTDLKGSEKPTTPLRWMRTSSTAPSWQR